jgi:hypothetical protein
MRWSTRVMVKSPSLKLSEAGRVSIGCADCRPSPKCGPSATSLQHPSRIKGTNDGEPSIAERAEAEEGVLIKMKGVNKLVGWHSFRNWVEHVVPSPARASSFLQDTLPASPA